MTSNNGSAPLPPHSIEAEEAVLGALLIDGEAYYEVSDYLSPGHFYSGVNGQIFRAIGDLVSNEQPVDLVTLGELLEGRDIADTGKLIPLINATPNSVYINTYARIVYATSMRRRLMQAAGKIATLANDENRGIDAILGESENELFAVTDKLATGDVEAARSIARALIDHTEAMYERGGAVIGLPTGLLDVDRLLEGLKDSELIIVAARPGMGKTALSLGVVEQNVKDGKRIALFNLEMPKRQIMQRLVAMNSEIDVKRLRRGQLTEGEWPRFLDASGYYGESKLFIDDTTDLTPTQLIAKCRRLHAKHGLDLVIVDYLQLMSSDRLRDSRVHEVSEISRALKKLAKMLDVPVVALSQLSRSCDARMDKRPILSDLRDSGSIEQDADVVMFIYRDEYYNPDTTDRPNVAEINVAKHRNGPTGTADAYWQGKITKFRNLQRQEVRL